MRERLVPNPRQGIQARDRNHRQYADKKVTNDRCQQKRPRRAALNSLIFLMNFGAGEGIRTLDPNLGKVVHSLMQSAGSGRHTMPDKVSFARVGLNFLTR